MARKNPTLAGRRIAVYGLHNRFLYYAPVALALQLVREQHATPIDSKSIQLPAQLSMLPESERDVRRASTSSIKTTEVLRLNEGRHRLIQHKYIHPSLKDLYNIAVEETCQR